MTIAGTKISALPNATALAGTEQLAGVQSAADVNITPAQLKTYGQTGYGTGVATALAANVTGSGGIVLSTAPAISNPTVTNYVETLYVPAANSAITVDLANGTIQKLTTNANFTATLPASVAGKSYTLIIAYGGAHTLTFAGGSTIKWAGGTTPTGTSVNAKFDIFTFICDGTNTYGAVFGQNF